jgi:hypothetical protein
MRGGIGSIGRALSPSLPSFHWIGHWMREQILEKKVGEGSVRLELELENVGMDGNILFGQNLGPKMKCF